MQTKTKKTVLIAGATGYLGRHLITAFGQAGYHVRVLVRNPDSLMDYRQWIDDVFVGEATVAETLSGCCKDIDLVVSALGITRQKDRLSYEQVDYKANSNILHEAIRADVKRFAYVHVLNAEKMQNVAMVRAKSKFAVELEQAPIASTLICPSGFFSDISEFLDMAMHGRVYLFGDGTALMSPIHGADLAELCIKETEAGLSQIDAGGPETFSQNQIALLAFNALGKTPRITHVPICIGRMAVFIAKKIGLKSKIGPIEFFLRASKIDMTAPLHGSRLLGDSFQEQVSKVRSGSQSNGIISEVKS